MREKKIMFTHNGYYSTTKKALQQMEKRNSKKFGRKEKELRSNILERKKCTSSIIVYNIGY